MTHHLGVCSWSLRPESPGDLAGQVRACGLSRVQLALDPVRMGQWPLGQTRAALDAAGVSIASGMMATRGEDYSSIDSIRRTGGLRPDEHWDANLAAAAKNADIACSLGIGLVTLHAGFIPEDAADPLRAVMIDRIARVAEEFARRDVRVALETGQESAEALREVLGAPALSQVGVNFDPANMLLYGSGDPTQALTLLAGRIAQVHMKDAIPSGQPDAWGDEVPAGTGRVEWDAFFGILSERAPDVGVIIEREAGESRVGDVRTAVKLAARHGCQTTP